MSAICPLDGRYASKIMDVTEHFGEFALMKNKIEIEVIYYAWFNKTIGRELSVDTNKLYSIFNDFSMSDYELILQIESQTKHDIKAVQLFVQESIYNIGCRKCDVENVHWGLTSQDIVNVSYYMSAKRFISTSLIKHMESFIGSLRRFIDNDPYEMIAYTHGQPAIKTTFNHEMAVYLYRINSALKSVDMNNPRFRCKIGGAVGSLNAHHAIYPEIDWRSELNGLCEEWFGMDRCEYSTQIENYQSLCSFLDVLRNTSNILVDLCRDMWLYAFNNTIKLKYVEGETGSSTMTQKINPIKFENAEGNFEMCNNLIEFMTRKLATSRLQRDLSDSTVIRNIGMVFGYFVLAIDSLTSGINSIDINSDKLNNDISSNGKIFTEYVQLYLKSMQYTDVDNMVSALFRNNELYDIHGFCGRLNYLLNYGVLSSDIEVMKNNILTPGFYRG